MSPKALAIYASCVVLAQTEGAILQPDHLLPVDLSESPAYRVLLRKKLERTPFDYGRVILRPAFNSESSISIYNDTEKVRTANSVVTCITAQDSLWDASEGGTSSRRALQIGTRRFDCVIPRALADQLRDAFSAVLRDTRPLGPDEKPKKIVLEGLITEFSIPRNDGSIARGEISSIPATGPKLKRLESLAFDLLAYCKASDADRAPLLRKIERNAMALAKLSQGAAALH